MEIDGGEILSLKFFKLHPNVQLPKFATEQSACFDLAYCNAGKDEYKGTSQNNASFVRYFTNEKLHIGPHERILVPTGLILEIPKGYSVRLHPRSGLSLRKGLVLANAEGVVDSDYFGELFLLMYNSSEVGHDLFNGDAIAQGELVKQESYLLEETLDKPGIKTSRIGGFGSTTIIKGELTDPPKTRPLRKKMVESPEIVAVNVLDKVNQS